MRRVASDVSDPVPKGNAMMWRDDGAVEGGTAAHYQGDQSALMGAKVG